MKELNIYKKRKYKKKECVCVCAYMCERMGERERERACSIDGSPLWHFLHYFDVLLLLEFFAVDGTTKLPKKL